MPGIIPIVVVISVIISAIYAGWATPTEAGSLGALVLVMALYNKVKFVALKKH